MSAPIFTAAQFAGVSYSTPVGQIGAPAHASDAVALTLSDGSTHVVFDTLATALRCLAQMNSAGQWYIQASDEVMVVSVGTKLLLLETTLTNQKLMQTYAAFYSTAGQTVFQNKSTSQQNSLTGALQKCGYLMQAAQPFQNNYDLAHAPGPPNIQIVDWFYLANPATSAQGSKLSELAGYPIILGTQTNLS